MKLLLNEVNMISKCSFCPGSSGIFSMWTCTVKSSLKCKYELSKVFSSSFKITVDFSALISPQNLSE